MDSQTAGRSLNVMYDPALANSVSQQMSQQGQQLSRSGAMPVQPAAVYMNPVPSFPMNTLQPPPMTYTAVGQPSATYVQSLNLAMGVPQYSNVTQPVDPLAHVDAEALKFANEVLASPPDPPACQEGEGQESSSDQYNGGNAGAGIDKDPVKGKTILEKGSEEGTVASDTADPRKSEAGEQKEIGPPEVGPLEELKENKKEEREAGEEAITKGEDTLGNKKENGDDENEAEPDAEGEAEADSVPKVLVKSIVISPKTSPLAFFSKT